jgi:hypothetical protein
VSPEGLPQRLDPLIRRLATNHDGERLATVAAIDRVLAAENLTFHDLADHVSAPPQVIVVREPESPPPRSESGHGNWRALVAELIDTARLTAWEYDFCTSIEWQLSRFRRLSEKQEAVLRRLQGKYLGGDER